MPDPAQRRVESRPPISVKIKVRAADTESLKNFLMEIQSLEGARSVRS